MTLAGKGTKGRNAAAQKKKNTKKPLDATIKVAIASTVVSSLVTLAGHASTFGVAAIGQETTTTTIVCSTELREAVKLQQETGVVFTYSGKVEETCQLNEKLKALAEQSPRPNTP